MHSAECEIEESKLMNQFTKSATSTTYKLNIKNPMVPNIGVTVSFSCWIVPMIADGRVAAAVWAVPPPTSTAQWEQIPDKRVGAGSLVHGGGAPLYKNHPSDVYNNKAVHCLRTPCVCSSIGTDLGTWGITPIGVRNPGHGWCLETHKARNQLHQCLLPSGS